MKPAFLFLIASLLFIGSCSNSPAGQTGAQAGEDTNPPDWKLGVALWTFHTVDFPGSLDAVDSTGLKYIEPNTFVPAGKQWNDSAIGQLSVAGIASLKSFIEKKGFHTESLYIVGDKTIQSWVKQFDIAKQLGAKYVTTEPPLDMWDSIDSLAGKYGIKVAIHEHWKGFSHYWNPDTTLMALKGHPNFGVCADLGHWPKSGIDPLEAVKKLAGHIFIIHLKDIAAYNDPKLVDVPVGTGVVKFPEIFAELKKQHFNGYIYIERDATDKPSNVASVRQEIKYYKEQVGKL
ncbi:MAG TPA: sugar phosphate isomerase/epimerase [Chitinophagaceae bacterium]